MGTNAYHQAHQADLFAPELSPARWLFPKGPSPKEGFQLIEPLDVCVEDRLTLLSRPAFRLPAKKSEQSLASRFEGLLAISRAIAIHHDIEGLVSALVTELFRVVDFDVIGMSRFEEATNRVRLASAPAGGRREVERVSMDGAKEETISAWIFRHQKPLTIPFLDQEKRLNRKITALIEDGIRSLCALPLICGHKRIGCLLIGSKQPEAYSNDEVRFLSLIADMVASALAGAINSAGPAEDTGRSARRKGPAATAARVKQPGGLEPGAQDSASRYLVQRTARHAM